MPPRTLGTRSGQGFENGRRNETESRASRSHVFHDLKLYPGKLSHHVARHSHCTPEVNISGLSGFVPRLETYMGPETPNPILGQSSQARATFESSFPMYLV